jgi:hypothetical protein
MKAEEAMMFRRMRRALLSAAVLAVLAGLNCLSHAQGTFQNLNFEAANVPDVPPGQGGDPVLVSEGVPGWTVYIGGIEQSSMFHNDRSIGAAEVGIYGPQWNSVQILEGRYTVSLQHSTAGPPTMPAIGQWGQIPQAAESLTFYGDRSVIGAYIVSFAGHSIPVATLGSTSTYIIFGGDISAFAGQTGELLFEGNGELDNIVFSDQPIPEPSVFGLVALGASLLGWRFVRRRQ